MNTNTNRGLGRCFRWVCISSVVFALAAARESWAVDPAKMQQQSGAKSADAGPQQPADSDRPSQDGQARGARDRNQAERDRHIDFSREGVPEFDRRLRQRWMLGVRVQYLQTGARVTYVGGNTPAWRIGLEP